MEHHGDKVILNFPAEADDAASDEQPVAAREPFDYSFDVTIREGPLGIGVSAVKEAHISRAYGMQFNYFTGKGSSMDIVIDGYRDRWIL
jgi:hypothetical protein